MNDEKSMRFNQMKDLRDFQHDTEENNRRKFNNDRVHSQTRIMQSMERTFQSNRGAYNDIKNQQNRINDMVHSNNV